MEDFNLIKCIKILSNFPTIYQEANITPNEIMKQSDYLSLFSLVTIDIITEHLIHNPHLIESWIKYSTDIRHSPAWGFEQNNNVLWVVLYRENGKVIDEHQYSDKFVACAKMIKMTFEGIREHIYAK